MKKIFDLWVYSHLTLKKLIMELKIAILIIVVSVSNVFATPTYSQEAKVSLNMENKTLGQVMDEIESQSEFYFIFNQKQINVDRVVNIQEDNKLINDILPELFKGTNVNYEVFDRKILLTTDPLDNNLLALASVTEPQQNRITGTVTDEIGKPLPGVTILIKGTTLGALTDAYGKYVLDNPPKNPTLIFSFVGMTTQEIPSNGQKLIDVVLKESEIGLNEVVVIGYGTQKKVNLTGAITTINTKQLSGQVATSATSLLEGRLPGVFITEGSGQPGATNMEVLIRGLGTMNNSNPMVLIDGIESTMNDINPYDIESVNVLKDAASSAIYGSRAANGVILVTTKRGDAGGIKVSFNTSIGTEKVIYKPKVLDSWDQATLMNEAYANSAQTPAYTQDEIQKFKSGSDPYNYPNTDWMGLLLNSGSDLMQTNSLTFSGGTEATRFLLSMETFDQKGLVMNATYGRKNLRFNLDSKINKWLKVGLNSSVLQNDVSEPTQPFNSGGVPEIFRQCLMIPSTAPLKDSNGNWVPWTNGNAIAWLEEGGSYKRNNSHVLGSVFGEINIMEGLVLKGIMGLNYNLDDDKLDVKSIQYANGLIQGPNSINDQLTRSNTVTLQSYLTYEKSFSNHNIKVLLGVDREATSYKYDGLYRNNLPSNALTQIDAGASSSMTNTGNSYEATLGSYFGRINYDYNKRYLFEANVRKDGCSEFGPGYRWGTFPSFSAGWRLSEENFLKDISWLNNLKLRGSWGVLGNHNIGNYLFLGKVTLGQNYPFFGGMQSGAATTAANVPNITWESTSEFDMGLDMDLFHNKFSAKVDYYNRLTDNILTAVPVSPVFGLPAPIVNAGSMRNKGVEFEASFNNTLGALGYNLSANIAFNDNKVEKFPTPSLGNTIEEEGVSWNSYYGYQCIGIYQTDAEVASSAHIAGLPIAAGDLKFKDQNGDGVIDAKDRIVLGNQIPRIVYGFNINLDYKNFDLSVIFQGVADAYNTVGNGAFWPFIDGGAGYVHNLDRTIVENGNVVTQGYFPRVLVNEADGQNGVFSSFLVLKSGYLRLKNLQFGYSLPTKLTEKVKLSRVRVYFSGKNLLTFTKFIKDFDPELRGDGNYTYPQTKVYTLGLNVNF